MPDKSSTREIIVTGSHRSGTSAISNFLVHLGLDVGDPEMLLKQAQDNQKGFFERLDVMSINDAILECANSSWHSLDVNILQDLEHLTVTDEIKSGIQNILNSFPDNNNPFLLKDPRFSLTLPVWLQYFSQPLIIVCLRNPLEIAKSLQKRNGFSIYKCLAIWETYLWSLCRHSKSQRCLFVNFNRLLEDPEKYGKRFVTQLNDYGIKNSLSIAKAIHSSFDLSLKNEECSDQDLKSLLSVNQMELWQKIKKEPGVVAIPERYWESNASEAMRQKDTDIGYSRLEIQLVTEFVDDCQNSRMDSKLVAHKEIFSFDIDSKEVLSFELIPLNGPCIIKFISFDVMSSKGVNKRITPASMNGLFDPEIGWYYFPQKNPSICFDAPFPDVEKVQISILFVSLNVDTVKQLLIDFLFRRDKRYTKQLSLKQHQNKKKDQLLNSLTSQKKLSRAKSLRKLLVSIYHLVKIAAKPKEFVSFIENFQYLTKESTLFSADYYCKNNKDVNPSVVSPLLHFLVFGWREGRDPSPEFHVRYYLETYRDVKEEGLNPLLHYIKKGWKEGRNPSPNSDTNKYITEYPEILALNICPLVHKQTAQQKLLDKTKEILQFENGKSLHIFQKPVAVIIPVYLANDGAVKVLELLLNSLNSSYPVPKKNLRFILLDDASPFRDCKSLLFDAGFINRSDVDLFENDHNLGFTGTINRGVRQVSKRSDIVILNSDTEIHGPIFETLQRACYREPDIGSVTPLSNRATISSLLNWPFGSDCIYTLKPIEVAQIVEDIGLIGPSNGAPTGHGFCMYMSSKTIRDVGLFDEKTFGQGYGEENDWSMRALNAGYRHHICTECFVFHHESKSFAPHQKSRLQRENTEKLNTIYPYYAEMVQKYLNEDPLKQHRNLLKLFLLESQKKTQELYTICFIIHDSFKNHEGGVQQHVKQLLNTLAPVNKYELMVISPNIFKGELYELHFFHQNDVIVLENLNEKSLRQVLPRIENRMDFLHVHHIHGLQSIIIDWITKLKVQRKILTIHDYDLFCSNPFLLNDHGEFCLAQKEKDACTEKQCLKIKEKNREILDAFDLLLTPSENCLKYVNKITKDTNIEEKLHTRPHFLPFIDEIITPTSPPDQSNALSKNIIFLGSLYPHKGGDVFLSSVEMIKNLGFHAYIWGHAQKSLLSKYINLPPIVPYKNWRELLELYLVYGAHIVVIPAVCAETFSYTLFEALFLFEVPVVVGPFGNPAEIVEQHGVGEVLTSTSPIALFTAVKKITNNYDYYQSAVKKYKNRYYSEFSPNKFLKNYTELALGFKTPADKIAPPSTTHFETANLSKESRALMNKALKVNARDRLRVLCIHALSQQDPPYFFRVENPVDYLEGSGCQVDIYHLDQAPLHAHKYDLIYLSRTPLTDKLEILLRNAKANKVPSILDVDDLIFHSDFLKHFYFLDKASRKYIRYKKLLDGIEKTFYKVDILLGSTPEIAVVGEKYGKKSIYFRNMLRFSQLGLYTELYKNRPNIKEYQIGYFTGSDTHNNDFELLIPVLTKFFNKYKDTKLLLMGFLQEKYFLQRFSKNITIIPFDSYDRYLKALQQCKVAIAPIANINTFSNAKSNIKFLEAAAVGTPTIGSPTKEMKYCIENGATGWLAESEEQWFETIEAAITGDYAEFLSKSSHAYVMDRFSDRSQPFNKLMAAIADTNFLLN